MDASTIYVPSYSLVTDTDVLPPYALIAPKVSIPEPPSYEEAMSPKAFELLFADIEAATRLGRKADKDAFPNRVAGTEYWSHATKETIATYRQEVYIGEEGFELTRNGGCTVWVLTGEDTEEEIEPCFIPQWLVNRVTDQNSGSTAHEFGISHRGYHCLNLALTVCAPSDVPGHIREVRLETNYREMMSILECMLVDCNLAPDMRDRIAAVRGFAFQYLGLRQMYLLGFSSYAFPTVSRDAAIEEMAMLCAQHEQDRAGGVRSGGVHGIWPVCFDERLVQVGRQ